MPIYTYGCVACGNTQDHLMSLNQSAPSCPQCGSPDCFKKMTAPAFAFKGANPSFVSKQASNQSNPPNPSVPGCAGSCACHPS